MSVVRIREKGGWIEVEVEVEFGEEGETPLSSEGSKEGSMNSEVMDVPVPPPLRDQIHSELGTVQSSSRACKGVEVGFLRRLGRRTEERMKGTSVVRTEKERWERVRLLWRGESTDRKSEE